MTDGLNDIGNFIIKNWETIAGIIGIIMTIIPTLVGIFKSYDLIKKPISIKGLEDFETRLKTKRINNVMIYITFTVMFFVMGLSNVYEKTDKATEVIEFVTLVTFLVGLLVTFICLLILFIIYIFCGNASNTLQRDKVKMIRVYALLAITLSLSSIIIMCCQEKSFIETIGIFKTVVFLGMMSILEILFIYLFVTSDDTDEYDALLYYLDNGERKYIYYKYNDNCFICGSEPNINHNKVYNFKKLDEIVEEKFYVINREYISYSKMFLEADEWIDKLKCTEKDKVKKELNKYKDGINNENLSDEEVCNFKKLCRKIYKCYRKTKKNKIVKKAMAKSISKNKK